MEQAKFDDKPDNYTPIHFLAQLLNDQKSREAGYQASVRWGSLREDLKEQYFNQAKNMYENWRFSEIENEVKLESMRTEMDSKTIDLSKKPY